MKAAERVFEPNHTWALFGLILPCIGPQYCPQELYNLTLKRKNVCLKRNYQKVPWYTKIERTYDSFNKTSTINKGFRSGES